ncbi:arginyl-tRNA--protein transferase 1-like [Glandiceps talaboti]
MSYSVVEYLDDHSGYKCGYCGSEDSNYSHGMWAHQMTCQDYQDLIDRGWRRSGKYVYKPTMNEMCCPSYTIRCQALDFKMSKSQKKVLKKMTKYLTVKDSGIDKSTSHEDDDDQTDSSRTEQKEVKQIKGLVEDVARQQNQSHSGEESKASSKKDIKPGVGADPSKPPCRKAKDLKQEKMGKGMTTSEERKPKNVEKTLEELLEHVQPGQQAVHNFEIKLVRSSPRSAEFDATFEQSFQVYAKYQIAIHKDPPSKCSTKQVKLVRSSPQSEDFKATFEESAKLFAKYQMAIHKDPIEECSTLQYKRFLVDSPLEEEHTAEGPDTGYGSFHQQYWLDGKIIAVGVLDILPNCTSSVYLYYDPDFSFLSLGTYSALQEVAFVKRLHQSSPDMTYYYMGFYIHSCVKMRYKGNYTPSFLLCPEMYTWIPIEKCRPKLDVTNYSKLDESGKADDTVDPNEAMILHRHQAIPYMLFKIMQPVHNQSQVLEYVKLVGKKCARSLLLYRS